MTEFALDLADAENAKLVTLARSARARTSVAQGAALRDTDGRTYAAAAVELASLTLSALQVAVAMAVSSGAPGVEAAVICADEAADPLGTLALRDLAPAAPVAFVDASGRPLS